MRLVRTAILRCRWGFFPDGWPDPPTIPDETLRLMFSRSDGGWGVAQLWNDATLGGIDFAAADLFDVGALPGLGITAYPDGTTRNPGRADVLAGARARAVSLGFPADSYDVTVVMISPPPCDAGAYGTGVVLDAAGTQSFMAHEFGHALGFNHSWGPAFGNPDTEYCDPYCVMSCDVFGYHAPWADSFPPGVVAPAGLPVGWTVQMGPLPAAAIAWRYSPEFAAGSGVLTYDLTAPAQPVTLTSYGHASRPGSTVLIVCPTGGPYTWFVEYRGAHGWDRGIGLGPKDNPGVGPYDAIPPAVVVHRRDGSGNIVYAGGVRADGGAGHTWSAADDGFTVTVDRIADDGSWAQVRLGPRRLNAVRVTGQTSQYGVACASVGDVFVNEQHYLGWTGTGNLRLNAARSDASDHQQSPPDTANGHVAVASDGTRVWFAWSGTNPGHDLNLFSAADAHGVFATKTTRVSDSSPTGPALAFFDGRVILAYRGEDDHIYVVAGADDVNAPAVAVGSFRTGQGPALTAYRGRLYLAWADLDGTLNVASSTDAVGWTGIWTLPGETTGSAPAILGADPDRLHLAWTGTNGGRSLNLAILDTAALTRANPAGTLSAKLTFATSSIGAPGLAATTNGGDIVLAWAAASGPGDLYTAYISDPFPVPAARVPSAATREHYRG